MRDGSLINGYSRLKEFLAVVSGTLTKATFVHAIGGGVVVNGAVLPVFFVFFARMLLLGAGRCGTEGGFGGLRLINLVGCVGGSLVGGGVIVRRSPRSGLVVDWELLCCSVSW